MSVENIVSIQVSSEQLQQVQSALLTIQEAFGGQLIVLRPDERRELPKINERNLPFVEKVMEYCVSTPQFAPPYLNIAELKIDLAAVKNLTSILRSFEQLYLMLSDTVMLSGSEAYVAALTYYHAVKQAAKVHVPGAEAVYNDLSVRFTTMRSKPKATEEPETV
jgi:hypothetical protein